VQRNERGLVERISNERMQNN